MYAVNSGYSRSISQCTVYRQQAHLRINKDIVPEQILQDPSAEQGQLILLLDRFLYELK